MNGWSCLPRAFAKALGVPLEEVLEIIGHDGSEIVHPSLPDPLCRRSFHPQEMIDVCEQYGAIVTEIQRTYASQPKQATTPFTVNNEARWFRHLHTYKGVLAGINSRGVPHATYWDGHKMDEWVEPAIFWRLTKYGGVFHAP